MPRERIHNVLDIEKLYADLERQVIRGHSSNRNIILMGDFNASRERDHSNTHGIMSLHGGERTRINMQ